jgi:signal transduction histidine kinase/tetratricopeptide (TPR) repeat protein
MSVAGHVGERLGRWTLQKKLGSGGFGSAWLAEDDNGYTAALKLLPGPPGGELRALAQVCHPAIPSLLDASGGARPFLAMELAPGRTLRKMIKAGRAPDSAAVTVVAVLADALSAVHQAGMIHGDVKPDNFVVNSVKNREMMLVDFGVAGTGEGGTLLYASPERLAGEPATPACDVYAVGLIAYEMLHTHLPWADLGVSMSLLKRKGEAPLATSGPEWLQRLMERMLALAPEDRPTADEVADACAAHGAVIPAPGPDLLRLRASRVHIPQPGVDEAIKAWVKDGGALAVVGPSGAGRTHAAERAAIELRAEGLPMIRLVDTGEPWGPIRAALASTELPNPPVDLPDDPDMDQRANACAALLEDRIPELLFLLADDLDTFDEGTTRTLKRLAERGRARILVTDEDAPAWATASVSLEELDADGVQELVRGVLGAGASLDVLADKLHVLSGGLPGMVVELLVSACQAQVLVRRNQRWMVGDGWMEELLAGGELAGPPVPAHSDEAAVGGLVALSRGPLPLADVAAMIGLAGSRVATAAHKLARRRLLHVDAGRVRCVSRVAARQLSGLVADPVRAHGKLLAWLDRQGITDPFRVAEHVIGSEDIGRALDEGAALVRAAGQVDRDAAARIADQLWALIPDSALVAPRIDALAMVGKVERAVAAGKEALEGTTSPDEQVAIWTAIGHAWLRADGQEKEALACVAEANAALGDGAPSLSLVQLEAQALFKTEQADEAVAVAGAVRAIEQPADPEDLDRWLSLHGVLAQSMHKTEQLPQAIELLESLPLDVGRGRPARALLDSVQGRLYWFAGRIRDAAEAIARAGAEGSGLSAIDRARTLNNAGLAHFMGGQRLKALECWEDALLLFEQLAAPIEQIRVSTNLCVGYREAGRWERGRQAGEQAVRWAGEQDQPELEAMAAGNLGDLYLAQHMLDETHDWYRHARWIASEHELSGELTELAKRDAELAVLQGSSDAMRKCDKAVRRAEKAEERMLLAKARALKAVCHARIQEVGRMQVLLEEAISDLREAGASGDLAEVRLLAAEAYHAADLDDQAREECDKVIVYAREVEHVPLRVRAEKLLETLAQEDQQSDHVAQLLELAVAVAQERDLTKLLDTIAKAGLKLLDGERAFVVLMEEGTPLVKATAQRDGHDPDARPSMTVVKSCIEGKKEVIAADLGERGELNHAHSIVDLELRSAMCVPLIDGDHALGAIYVDSRIASEKKLSRSALFMRALASHGAIAVVNARNMAALAGHAAWARGIAHDMKSPINSMIALSRDLDPYDPQAVEEARRDLQSLGRRAVQMAQGFLDGESVGPKKKDLDLSAFAGESLRLLGPRAKVAEVQMHIEVAPGLRIRGDKTTVDRIIGNVVGNAFKYSDPGGQVWVQLTEDDGQAKLVVLDDGPGIPPGFEDKIWGADVQAEGARKGNGVGLGVVRAMIEDMGGTVASRNHPEHGAEFTLCIPLSTVGAAAGA